MIKTKRDVYITEFQTMSFRQRHYYVLHNELVIDWDNFKIGFNPLRWCILDILKLIYVPILLFIIYPLLICIVSLYLAKELKTRYKDEEDKGWFKSDRKVIDYEN